MDWNRLHAAAKSAFLSGRQWREKRLSPAKSQLSQFFLREVNSWSTWIDQPLTERLRNYRHGFLSHSAALYDFETHGRDAYLSDIQREKTAFINDSQFVSVLANKVGFYVSMEPFDDHRPDTFGVIADGRFHPIRRPRELLADGAAPSDSPLSSTRRLSTAVSSEGGPADRWVLDRLQSGDELVLKPVNAAGGDGVRHCTYDGQAYRVNGTQVSPRRLRKTVSTLDASVAMAFVEQASYANKLFPDATNTIRVITMWDNENGEAFSPAVVHRIGTERSAPVDNFDRTGIAAKIDPETGELGTGIQLAADGSVREHDVHPDTGSAISGRTVPGWQSIFEGVLEIAAAFSYVPYVGWDVVVTGPGEFALLEANNCPGLKSLQAHDPLLLDDRARRFYARHGVCAGT